MFIILVLLIYCSWPHHVSLTTLNCGENLTCLEPEIKGSRADLRLPFYTSGFE